MKQTRRRDKEIYFKNEKYMAPSLSGAIARCAEIRFDRSM
jgi:hypothetical protein